MHSVDCGHAFIGRGCSQRALLGGRNNQLPSQQGVCSKEGGGCEGVVLTQPPPRRGLARRRVRLIAAPQPRVAVTVRPNRLAVQAPLPKSYYDENIWVREPLAPCSTVV